MFRVTVTSFWRFQDRAIIKSSSSRSIRLEYPVVIGVNPVVIGVKRRGRGKKTCERFVTHNSQLVNDLEYGDDLRANYFSRHSTSPNHRACIPLLDSRRLRTRECWGVTVRSIQLRWYPFRTPSYQLRMGNFLTQGAYGSNPKKRFFQKRLEYFFRKLTTL